MQEYIEPLLSRLVAVITSGNVARSLTENSAVTIGRLALACPQLVAPHIDQFIRQWCVSLICPFLTARVLHFDHWKRKSTCDAGLSRDVLLKT